MQIQIIIQLEIQFQLYVKSISTKKEQCVEPQLKNGHWQNHTEYPIEKGISSKQCSSSIILSVEYLQFEYPSQIILECGNVTHEWKESHTVD